MIVRTWHGCVPLEHAEGFAKHLEKTGVAFLSGNLLAGSAVSEGICWRKLSCGGHLPG